MRLYRARAGSWWTRLGASETSGKQLLVRRAYSTGRASHHSSISLALDCAHLTYELMTKAFCSLTKLSRHSVCRVRRRPQM